MGGKFRGARRKKNRKRRKASLKKRVPSHLSDRSSDIVEKFASLPVDHPFNNPTFHGSIGVYVFLNWIAIENVGGSCWAFFVVLFE